MQLGIGNARQVQLLRERGLYREDMDARTVARIAAEIIEVDEELYGPSEPVHIGVLVKAEMERLLAMQPVGVH